MKNNTMKISMTYKKIDHIKNKNNNNLENNIHNKILISSNENKI